MQDAQRRCEWACHIQTQVPRDLTMLQVYTSGNIKQLDDSASMLTQALQEARTQIELSDDVEMLLAVSRGLEVLSCLFELLDKQRHKQSSANK